MPWATPHIQITACSEEQTDNTWRAIQPMIELGPARRGLHPRHRPHPDQPALRRADRTGHRVARAPGSGSGSPSSSRTRPRAGCRSNNGHWLADNQRRNVAGMGGRFLETCNAPDPAEQSVASRTPGRARRVHRRHRRRPRQRPQQGRTPARDEQGLRRLAPSAAAAGSTSTGSTPKSKRCSNTTPRRPSASSSTASSRRRAPRSTSKPSRASRARAASRTQKPFASASTVPATTTRSPSSPPMSRPATSGR